MPCDTTHQHAIGLLVRLSSQPRLCLLCAHVQDELREREQEVASLSMTVKQYELQIDGLQTILSAKVCQCNRVATELKDVSKQLRQSEAAAVSEHAAMTLQIQQLSEEVTEAQEDLADGVKREQQLQAQLAATRAKVGLKLLHALVPKLR